MRPGADEEPACDVTLAVPVVLLPDPEAWELLLEAK
jgi:hypothetical protein